MIPTESLISLYLQKYSYFAPSKIQHFQIVKNVTSTYYHLFFLTQNLNLRHTHKTNGKKLKILVMRDPPLIIIHFPQKKIQHKTVKRQSNVPVINGGGYGEGSKRVRQRPEYRQRRLIETGDGE